MDVNSLYDAKHPMNLFTVEYAASCPERFVVEGRFSARNETLKDVGARSQDQVIGTLLVDRSGRRYWSPTFCGVCDPEQRDGQEVFAKGSYFSSTKGLGSHQMVFGYDGYNDRRLANNHQSGSDYRILGHERHSAGNGADAAVHRGRRHADPVEPDLHRHRTGRTSGPHSLFYNDNWRVSNRLTANLGLRYDRNHGVDSSKTLVTSACRVVSSRRRRHRSARQPEMVGHRQRREVRRRRSPTWSRMPPPRRQS